MGGPWRFAAGRRPSGWRRRRGRSPPGSGTLPPPVATRWKKGQSGNPGGRPKGKSLVALMREVLEREHNGRPLSEVLAAIAGGLPANRMAEWTPARWKAARSARNAPEAVA